MAKRRLFLHIGLPKTGTSFIQAVLDEQRAALQKQGILYPATGLDGFGHKLLAIPFLSDERKRFEDARAALDRKLVTLWSDLQGEILRSGASKIILSSEYFSEAVTVRVLRSICDRNDVDASVIVYLRRQDQVLESGYNQAVKVGIETAKVVLGEKYIEALDYDALLGRWADVFGDEALLVRTFEDAVAGPGILEDFMCLIGAELDIPNASVERNEGLHPGLIDFRRLENVVGLIDSRLTKPVNPLLRKLDPRPGLSLMSAENRERFLSYYAESNARVARRYLGKQDGVLFAGPEGEAAEDLLEADAYLSTILSCAYNDMMAKMVGAERRRSDLQAEVDRISTELTSLRRVERELISLRAEVDALRTGPSSLSTLDKGANRPQPGVQVESSDRNAFWRSLLRRLIWRE